MLDEGVESLSDGIHRIHRTRTDSDGKVYILFVRYLEKLHPCWLSSSDGIHRIHWRRTDSDGKVHVPFVRYLEKFHPCWLRGQEVVLMESIGSIGDQQIEMEKCMIYLFESLKKFTHVG